MFLKSKEILDYRCLTNFLLDKQSKELKLKIMIHIQTDIPVMAITKLRTIKSQLSTLALKMI